MPGHDGLAQAPEAEPATQEGGATEQAADPSPTDAVPVDPGAPVQAEGGSGEPAAAPPVEGVDVEGQAAEQVVEQPAQPALTTREEVPDTSPVQPFQDPGVYVGGGMLAVIAFVLVTVMVRGEERALVEHDEDTGPEEDDEDPTFTLTTPALAPPPPAGLAARLRERMSASRQALQGQLDRLFGRTEVDDDLLEELEEVLLIADVGVPTTEKILAAVRQGLEQGETDPLVLRDALRAEVRRLLGRGHESFSVPDSDEPFVMLIVGVNGSGKTTTIGKLAARFQRQGKKVLLAAGDTYRAAAAEQLQIWAERSGAEFVRHDEGSDPGAVAYDAVEAAIARHCDVVIVDTAGRLQTRRPLMEQLGKVQRVLGKKLPGAPHETWLVVDGTMGQNAMSQARSFNDATPLTGVVVTKLDGTAKGGMVLSIAAEMGIPVRFLGIGEQVDDLRPFEPEAFIEALL